MIKKEVIQKSFLTTGIAQKKNGIEDDYFISPKGIEQEIAMDYIDESQKNDDSSDDYITD